MRAGRGVLSVAAGMVLLALATMGYALPPPFDPPPLNVDPVFQTLPAQPAAESRPVSANGQITVEDVTVDAGDTTLGATIRAPLAPGRHPALIFVQGAGPGVRDEFTTQAEWLARAGIVTLVYDKRTVRYDFRNRDFGLLADDALRVLARLRLRADVDPDRVGLWGVSEGSWVVPIAAARSADVGFTVLVSAPNVSPLRQVSWALSEQLDRLHAPSGVRELLIRAMSAVHMNFLRYDGLPALRRLHRPVLALYGTRDPSIPFVESSKALTGALAEGGNADYTIRYLEGADHGMRVRGGPFARGYLETLANWVKGLPGTARPAVHIAGATPVQRYEASDVPTAPWYAGATVLGLMLCLAAVGYVVGPVTEMVLRLRGRQLPGETNARIWPPIRRRFRRMAWTGAGLLVSVVAFITLLVLFSVNQAGAWPAVLAGWLVIRILAVLMLLQEVTAVAAVVSGLREGWRPSRPQRVAIGGVLGGTGLLLVAGAYYSLFAFPW
ncbi:prolyl oligopeptidase family serine peptidase [Streptosporangium sp. NPDC051022]|uniref:alpha/beta hydrolase family protein n=1 Tax=Streptosporangium sp. NPDC051022 TaxID=3155752 RepID=UPI0034370E79